MCGGGEGEQLQCLSVHHQCAAMSREHIDRESSKDKVGVVSLLKC